MSKETRGRPALPKGVKRELVINVRFNNAEMARLNAAARRLFPGKERKQAQVLRWLVLEHL
jgi:hypothetical protein